MLKTILSISGRPGLFRLINRGKGNLIVEELTTGKRTPAYARDKVISLGDISIYTDEGDTPLGLVLETVKEKNDGKQVDIKAIGDLREYFAGILPEFDRERVYTTDIRKLLQWYNLLIATGITDFKPAAEDETEAPAETKTSAEAETTAETKTSAEAETTAETKAPAKAETKAKA